MDLQEHQSHGSGAIKRLLLIEDEPLARKAIGIFLRACGYEVTEAKDGVEALDILAGSQFDAVITDLVIPRIDGVTIIRYLRAHGIKTPVIVTTGYDPSAAAVLDLPNLIVMKKPLFLNDLAAALGLMLFPTHHPSV